MPTLPKTMTVGLDVADIDYRPTGTLEIDTRRVPTEDVEKVQAWRTNKEAGALFGKSEHGWWHWLHYGVDEGPSAAVFREIARGNKISRTRAPREEMIALCNAIGGVGNASRELSVSLSCIKNWVRRGVTDRSMAGTLVHWLFEDMMLEPQDKLTYRGSGSFTPSRVRKIRRLSKEGVTYREIADRFDVSGSTISNIVNRKTYKWVK